MFSKDYIEFEIKHMKELELLWYETQDEELRKIILEARKVLQRIYCSMK